jgi:hypothetical protein
MEEDRARGGDRAYMSIETALGRTMLLMRDHLRPDTQLGALIEALCSTEIVIVSNSENLVSNSAQSAVITAASLVARSGGVVYLDLPSTQLRMPQPPLRLSELGEGLVELGRDILPGRKRFIVRNPVMRLISPY